MTMEKTKEEREELKRDLRYKGYSVKRIAEEAGVSGTMVTGVIKAHNRSRRIEDRIAEILGRDPGEIWEHRRILS
ncbi:helix-turn-helix domain-containing protein [Frigidibacter sp. MR17.24]|uniref:helix-turn-helix domain-containing protein n=1 Tax=Frigidibacter sp. MR17.24 TaxID=3127345 RepID=UPI003012F63F